MKKRLNFLCVLLVVTLLVEFISGFVCSIPGIAGTEYERPELLDNVSRNTILIIAIMALSFGLFSIYIGIQVLIKFIKLILNINRGKVFVKENIPLLRWIACGYLFCFVASIIYIVLFEEPNVGFIDYLVESIFCFIIAEAFAIGINLREEQELTI